MKARSLINSFAKCLKECNLNGMTKDMYEFFNLRCGFIAHYDIHGFRTTYEDPKDFLEFCNTLKENLISDVKSSDWHKGYTDNTDSFKWDYEFKIPEVKKVMLSLLNNNSTAIKNLCNKEHLTNLVGERKRLDSEIELLQKSVANVGLNKFTH